MKYLTSLEVVKTTVYCEHRATIEVLEDDFKHVRARTGDGPIEAPVGSSSVGHTHNLSCHKATADVLMHLGKALRDYPPNPIFTDLCQGVTAKV